MPRSPVQSCPVPDASSGKNPLCPSENAATRKVYAPFGEPPRTIIPTRRWKEGGGRGREVINPPINWGSGKKDGKRVGGGILGTPKKLAGPVSREGRAAVPEMRGHSVSKNRQDGSRENRRRRKFVRKSSTLFVPARCADRRRGAWSMSERTGECAKTQKPSPKVGSVGKSGGACYAPGAGLRGLLRATARMEVGWSAT